MKTIIFFAAFVLVLITAAIFLTFPPKVKGNLDDFAKCLAQKGATMYGASWCPHCQYQKSLFGTSFKYIPYVECPDNPKACLDHNVTGYPTWLIGSVRLEGQQSLDELAHISSCQLSK